MGTNGLDIRKWDEM